MRLLFYISYPFGGEFTKIEQGSYHTLLTTNKAFLPSTKKAKEGLKNAERQKNAEWHSG